MSLREAGLHCDAHRVRAYLAAVEQLDIGDPAQLYWAGRLTLCAAPNDLPRYEQAFARWFEAESRRHSRWRPSSQGSPRSPR